MRRHKKAFRCSEPGCPRKDGFGTQNDLDRHINCKHKTKANGMVFKCFGRNCTRKGQLFPRKDNFKQHLSRTHGDEDSEYLLSRSVIFNCSWV